MVRKIFGAVVGAIVVIVVCLLAGGTAAAMFHLAGLQVADSDHPHAALAAGAIAVFAIGAGLGGLIGGYLAALISRWPMVVWVVAAVGAIDNYLSAEMFANAMTLFLPCLVAVGAWAGGRLPRPAAAIPAS